MENRPEYRTAYLAARVGLGCHLIAAAIFIIYFAIKLQKHEATLSSALVGGMSTNTFFGMNPVFILALAATTGLIGLLVLIIPRPTALLVIVAIFSILFGKAFIAGLSLALLVFIRFDLPDISYPGPQPEPAEIPEE